MRKQSYNPPWQQGLQGERVQCTPECVWCMPRAISGSAGVFNLLEASHHNHVFEVTSGVLAKESSVLLQDFFRARRQP